MNIIEIKNITHRFANGRSGLNNISMDIARGQFVVLAGANGSGKTTLLRHFNGLMTPQQGVIIVDGVNVADDPVRARRTIGMVFQDTDTQIVGETVYDEVAFGPENLCWPRSVVNKAVQTALDQMGLVHLSDQSPHLLSGGERRRLTIAGILAMNPSVLVFDEPFANLDYPGVRDVLRRIVALHQEGHTIVIAAHDLEKVIAHAQRLIILSKGCVAADGAPNELLPSVEDFDIRRPIELSFGHAVQSWLN
ncbi:MAG: ABC transporter ATP-binding protein [Desulfatitalea sp. BRH_c12]|nr:MAG: ABC transporter ATP-binding protein [Desulfatitalea sp. BRH_c12]